jgi:anti-sigma-K factor RskA
MFTLTIAVAVLSVLYGLAWHSEPARQPVVVRLADEKKEFHE